MRPTSGKMRAVTLDALAFDDEQLDLLADLLADRLAARFSLATEPREALVDAKEIARLTGKTKRARGCTNTRASSVPCDSARGQGRDSDSSPRASSSTSRRSPIRPHCRCRRTLHVAGALASVPVTRELA